MHRKGYSRDSDSGLLCGDCSPVRQPEKKEGEATLSPESRLIEEMKKGTSLRAAQEALIKAGEKKNAVKQAAIALKKMFSGELNG